jgi:ABC-type cobalamin/Fe3+-siderophores transport system ATPase subunit
LWFVWGLEGFPSSPACCTGLLGRNGSGKTTFLKFLVRAASCGWVGCEIWRANAPLSSQAAKGIEGIPWYLQILHVSQEVRWGGP